MITKIFCDIADISLIKKFNEKKIVKGFTTNPSLMRKAGAKNYKSYSDQILKICKRKPVSFEVFADDLENMIVQGTKGISNSQSMNTLCFSSNPTESLFVATYNNEQ